LLRQEEEGGQRENLADGQTQLELLKLLPATQHNISLVRVSPRLKLTEKETPLKLCACHHNAQIPTHAKTAQSVLADHHDPPQMTLHKCNNVSPTKNHSDLQEAEDHMVMMMMRRDLINQAEEITKTEEEITHRQEEIINNNNKEEEIINHKEEVIINNNEEIINNNEVIINKDHSAEVEDKLRMLLSKDVPSQFKQLWLHELAVSMASRVAHAKEKEPAAKLPPALFP